MALRMTEEEYRALMQRRNSPTAAAVPPPFQGGLRERDGKTAKRSKYGNRKTEADGMTFDSAHEARVWKELKMDMLAGTYKGVARQVTFQLPGGVTYVADFVTFNQDGSYTVIDAKSSATKANAVYRLKKKQMANCLGIEIKEV